MFDDLTYDPADLADGYNVTTLADDGPDDDGPDYRDKGHGPDAFDRSDDDDDGPDAADAWLALAESDAATITVPIIGSPGPVPITIVPDDHPERRAVLASIAAHKVAADRADRARKINADPSVGPWSSVTFGPDAYVPAASADPGDPASVPLGPVPADAPAPLDVFRSTWRKFPRTAPRRYRTGRAPARGEMLAASRLRDRGTAPARVAAALGLSRGAVGRLAAMDLDTARTALAAMVDGLADADRDRARTVVRYSDDWSTVGPWIDTTGTRSAPDRGHETIPIGTGGTWSNVPGTAPITLVRPDDGPGTLQMLAMESARYVGSTARYAGAGTSERGARSGAEGTAPMLVQWSIRSKTLPAAFVRPMGVEVSPRVMAARRPFPRIGAGRIVWRADGTHVRIKRDGTARTVSHKAGATVPSAVRSSAPVRLDGIGQIDPATMTVVPSVTPEGERERARLASVLRGPVTVVTRFGIVPGSAPAATDRIAVRKDGTLRKAPARKGSGAGSRGGRKPRK